MSTYFEIPYSKQSKSTVNINKKRLKKLSDNMPFMLREV